jgi:hypothetical protein
MRRVAALAVRVLASYALAITILLLMLLLTYFGTMEQKHRSIYDVQRDYFESWLVVHRWEGPFGLRIPVPLPGATLLLGLLAVNLVVGGMVRLRKRAATAGVLIAHVGIFVLLAGGLVEFFFSEKGNLALLTRDRGQGENRGDEFEAYHEWDLVVSAPLADGRVQEHVLPYERLERLRDGAFARFTSASLPFEVRVSGWQRNAEPETAGQGGVGGFVLRALPVEKKSEHNLPGLLATVTSGSGGERPQHGLLWGAQSYPWRVLVEGRPYDLDLRRRRWRVPFELRLERFVAAFHPGTDRPKEFSSYVTKVEDGAEQAIHITMNQPLRHRGFTFYQSSYAGPFAPETPGGEPVWQSVFSVVENPADRIPILACVIIGLGLLWTMVWKLVHYVQAQARSVA